MTCIAFRTATDILDTQEHTSVVRSWSSVHQCGEEWSSVHQCGEEWSSVHQCGEELVRLPKEVRPSLTDCITYMKT